MKPEKKLKTIAKRIKSSKSPFLPKERVLRCPEDNFYLGLSVDTPQKAWERAREIAREKGDIESSEYLKDRGEFHITVLSPKELRKVLKDHPELKEEPVKITTTGKNGVKYLGIGRAEKNGNVAYFIVVDWPAARKLRAKYLGEEEANKQEFHITLGFKEKDVFGDPPLKGPESLVEKW